MHKEIGKSYRRLLDGNDSWSKKKLQNDPEYFEKLSMVQKPEFLWVGCSDSRVPANEITNTTSGEIFVHRNIANLVIHTDLNFLSVLQYAVEVLNVKHIIVCGHYGCGGILAAMSNESVGLVNKWLRNIKEVYLKHQTELDQIESMSARADRLVELNVIEQVRHLAMTSIVQKAWKNRGLQIHGWVYGLNTGKIKDLDCMMHALDDLDPIFRYTNL